MEGATDADGVADGVGDGDGVDDGLGDGEGVADGLTVGVADGLADGLGDDEGPVDGLPDGLADGLAVGTGVLEGAAVGTPVATAVPPLPLQPPRSPASTIAEARLRTEPRRANAVLKVDIRICGASREARRTRSRACRPC